MVSYFVKCKVKPPKSNYKNDSTCLPQENNTFVYVLHIFQVISRVSFYKTYKETNIRKTNNVASQHLALYFLSHVLKMKGEIEHPLRRMFHCDG